MDIDILLHFVYCPSNWKRKPTEKHLWRALKISPKKITQRRFVRQSLVSTVGRERGGNIMGVGGGSSDFRSAVGGERRDPLLR